MASTEGFLTDEQREMLKVASQNVETALPSPRLSSSPKSPTSLLSDHQLKVPAVGKAPTGGIAVRHVRRSHSGKCVRVKKGEPSYYFGYLLMVIFFELFNSMHLFLLSPIWVFVL